MNLKLEPFHKSASYGKRLTLINSLSKKGAMFRKQARESLLALLIKESIHLNSFNLLNLKSSHLKITPDEHSHFGNGIYDGSCQQKKEENFGVEVIVMR